MFFLPKLHHLADPQLSVDERGASERVNKVLSLVDWDVTKTFLVDIIGLVCVPRIRKDG